MRTKCFYYLSKIEKHLKMNLYFYYNLKTKYHFYIHNKQFIFFQYIWIILHPIYPIGITEFAKGIIEIDMGSVPKNVYGQTVNQTWGWWCGITPHFWNVSYYP